MVLVILFCLISIKLPPHISPLPNQYRAYAIVLFHESGGNAGMMSLLSTFGVESSTSETSVTQLAIKVLQSRSFIDGIVKKFNIINKYNIEVMTTTKSREIINKNSEYTLDRDTGTLAISFTDIDPVFASELVNYEVNLLEKWFLEQDISLRSVELSKMENKLNNLTKEISEIEGDIKNFQQQHGVLDINEIASVQSAMISDLRTTLNQVELEINDYSEYSTIEDPALTILKNRRQNIINQIMRIEGGYVSSDGRNMPSTQELPQLSMNFAHMNAELALKNQLFQTLSERYEITKLAAAEEGVFRVFEYAEIPEQKIGPSRGRLCMIVTMVSFMSSILFSLLINTMKSINPDKRKK